MGPILIGIIECYTEESILDNAPDHRSIGFVKVRRWAAGYPLNWLSHTPPRKEKVIILADYSSSGIENPACSVNCPCLRCFVIWSY